MSEDIRAGNCTEKNLHITMSYIAEGVISIDKEGRITFINQAAQKLTGWDENEAIRLPLDTVFNIIDAKTLEKADFLHAGEKASLSDNPILITRSGSRKYISVNSSDFVNEDGLVSGVVITFRDVTSYRQVEEELKIERNNLRTQFQYAPVGMVIVDENSIVQSVNDRYIDMFGNQNDNVIGSKLGKSLGCVSTLKDICGEGDECNNCPIKESVKKVIKSRIPLSNAEKRYKLLQNGKTFIRSLKFNIVPINVSGRINVLISVDDMTEYREMEEKLIKSRDFYLKARDVLKRYEVLSEKARDIILFIDMNGRIIEANEAAVKAYGYSREELLSKTIYDIRMDRNFTKMQMDEASECGAFFECMHFRKDGSSLPVEVSSQSTMHGDSKVLMSIIRDISERKQIELEMRKAMEATKAAYTVKSEFLANISHEIRTPLNGIIGMIDLTMLTELTYDQMDNLTTAKSCANSLLNIINDVLDFSKMEAGKMTIEHVEFDLKVLIEKTVKIHLCRAEEKGIELTYQLPADLPDFLIGDPNRLQQVLNNLLSNAIKFTEKGYVNLVVKTLSCEDDFIKLQISIADTGIGISSEDRSKLFKSFSQIDGSQTRRFGGTGLGLVISRQLIEMMRGTLKVESEKGKGSVFSLVLKLKVGTNTRGIVDNKEQKNIGKTKTEARILLTEDDKVNQVVISRMLMELSSSIKSCDHEIKPIIVEAGKSILKLMQVIKTGNMQKTEEHAHKVKTLASSINAEKLKTLAFRIELAARRDNHLEVAELLKELVEVFGKYTSTL